MDKSTNEVRALSWAAIINQCQSRPEGQSAKQWALRGIVVKAKRNIGVKSL